MKRYVMSFVCGIVVCCAGSAWAQVQLSVTKSYGRKIKAGVVSQGNRNVGKTVRMVVVNDMRLSGSFNVPRDLVFDVGSGQTPKSLVMRGAEVAIRLESDVDGVRCAVFSGGRDLSPVLTKFYPVSADSMRGVAHKIADDIIYALTGEQGFALSGIVYCSDKGGNKNIYMMDHDGGAKKKLTLNKSVNIFPDMASDKSFLVYTSYMKGHPYLYRQDKSGKIEIISKRPGLNALPSISSAKDVAMVLSKDGNPEVYTINRFGGDLKRITRSKGIDTSPTWSPDGKKMAFVSNRRGNPQIYVVDADGDNLERLTYSGKYNSSPSWSPKGNMIAYASMSGNKFDIFVIDIESGDVYQITDDNASNESPSWGPNGVTLVYSATEKGRVNLKIIDIYEKKPRQITFSGKDGNCMNPKWIY